MLKRLIALSTALTLTASCGGGDDNDDGGSISTPPARGTLIERAAQPTALPAVTLANLLSSDTSTQTWLTLFGNPQCDVQSYHLRYNTVGGTNEATEASAALMVPSGSSAACSGARPIVLYAHGTNTDRAYDIANLNDAENGEGLLIAAAFAAQGYIVVAPNYAGYDTSTLAYHPYLNADQSAKDMIDALAAARSAMPVPAAAQTTAGSALYITGYSQGGHVAMATHRAMEAAGMTVTRSAPMSGPYALSAFGDAVFFGRVNLGAPIFATLLVSSYQKSYGNLYGNTSELFEAQYASGIDSLLPSTLARGELYAQGKLPPSALFNSTPPDAAYASITPATEPAELATVFALGFGTSPLITNSYRLGYLQDAQTYPDTGWPNTTTNQPPAAPAHALRQDLKRNDLRNWTPLAPILLCGGNSDPTVFWFNAQLLQAYWTAAAPAAPVTVLDVDSSTNNSDPYADLKQSFALAKDLLATTGGSSAVLEGYHDTLVPPFCLAAAKSFFAQ